PRRQGSASNVGMSYSAEAALCGAVIPVPRGMCRVKVNQPARLKGPNCAGVQAKCPERVGAPEASNWKLRSALSVCVGAFEAFEPGKLIDEQGAFVVRHFEESAGDLEEFLALAATDRHLAFLEHADDRRVVREDAEVSALAGQRERRDLLVKDRFLRCHDLQ